MKKKKGDSLKKQAIFVASLIPYDLLIKLGNLIDQGIIPISGLRHFVDNPSVFLGTMPPLELARASAQMARNPQDRAYSFTDLIEVTHDFADLEPVVQAWLDSTLLNQSLRDEVGIALVRSYLACDEFAKAYQTADAVPSPACRAEAWALIAEHTKQMDTLSEARQLLRFLTTEERIRCLCMITFKSNDLEDLKLTQLAIEEAFQNTAIGGKHREWFRVYRARLLLQFGKYEEAREVASAISDLELRIVARYSVAQATKDEDDLTPLIFNLKDCHITTPKALEGVTLAYLACNRADLARRFANTRKDQTERCFIFSLIAVDEQGDAKDIEEAELAYRSFNNKPGHFSSRTSAETQFISALAKRGRFIDATIAASNIAVIRLRVRAYLAIYRTMNNL